MTDPAGTIGLAIIGVAMTLPWGGLWVHVKRQAARDEAATADHIVDRAIDADGRETVVIVERAGVTYWECRLCGSSEPRTRASDARFGAHMHFAQHHRRRHQGRGE